MGLKWSKLNLKQISTERSFRIDHEIYLGEAKFKEFINNFKNVVPLGTYISEIRNGQDVSRSVYTDDNTGILYLSVNQIVSGLFDKLDLTYAKMLDIELDDVEVSVESGDILITRSGTPGIAWLATKEFLDKWNIVVPSGYLQRVQVNGIDPEFLVAYLNLPPVRMLTTSYACGKDQVNLSQEYIKQIPIPILPEEKKTELIELAREARRVIREVHNTMVQIKDLYQSYAPDILSGYTDMNILNDLKRIQINVSSTKYADWGEKWKLPRRRGFQPSLL